jgi:general secretion pathway protein G
MKLRLKSKASFALITVGLIVLVLLVLGRTEPGVRRTREKTFRMDLRVMREAIDKYTLDKQKPPQSLQELVDANYFRVIPVDPITQRADWVGIFGEYVTSSGRKITGLRDVHSNSSGVASSGERYNMW